MLNFALRKLNIAALLCKESLQSESCFISYIAIYFACSGVFPQASELATDWNVGGILSSQAGSQQTETSETPEPVLKCCICSHALL